MRQLYFVIKKNTVIMLSVLLLFPGLFVSCSQSVQKKTDSSSSSDKVDFNADFEKIRKRLVSESCQKDTAKKCKSFLHYLAASGNLDVIQQLDLKTKYNINVQDNLGNTPLHYAFMNNQQDVAEYLIKNGADSNLKNVRGRTPIHLLVLFLPMDGSSIPTNFPAKGDISSPFGIRKGPFTGEYEFHSAIDIAAPMNTEIRASADGRVIKVGWNKGLGKIVRINHYNGFETIYAHCNTVLAEYYSKVKKGQKIAEIGSTGYSTGSHCHYAIIYKGQPINPFPFMLNKFMRDKFIAKTATLIELAVKNGYNINQRDLSGRTALHYAVNKSFVVTKELLGKKASVNLADYYGMTALHFAASSTLHITGLLLRSGAYVNARTVAQFKFDSGRYLRRGTTPMGIALRNENLAMAKLLSRFGGRE